MTLPTGSVTPTAQAVLEGYCEAMAEAGTPVAQPGPVLAGIKAAMKVGYTARMTLIGLGMWEAEGYRQPKQITEWVEKAARQGSEPSQAMGAADLLLEGRARYQQYLVRRELATPSKAEVRRAESARSISRYLQGQG
ncbi:hypothetical protein [Kocuria marina]|uniref:hypothetical protein n=1 Tax=Kocuria marina TaxID=223184 RepID=UPI00117AD51B